MNEKTPERSALKREDTWQLEDIFASLADWEKTEAEVKAGIAAMAQYEGKLSDEGTLLCALRDLYTLERKAEALFTFARMRRDEDNRDAASQGLVSRAQSLMAAFGTAVSFLKPEVLSLPEEYIRAAAEKPEFAEYRVPLMDLNRERPHTLSAAEEKLVAMTGEMGNGPDNIYSMLTDADMKFPTVKDEAGRDVEITHGNFIALMMNKDRAVRRAAFDGLYGTYKAYSNTIPAIYAASVNADVFYARAAKHESALASKLFPDDVPLSVYENLIETVHRHIPSLSRFVRRNGELIGVGKDMSMIDVYVPPVAGFDIALPFDRAYDLVVESLAPLGEDYQAVLRRARAERWIDPFENVGKSSGAYSWGTYDSHPFVLMNYHESLDSLLTIAHEMGHSMHSYYSNAGQPYTTAGYSLFVAEVASTTNECLVLMELLKRYENDKNAQTFIVAQLLENFRTTVFRQTMFAEFEKISHEMAERGEPLNADSLNAQYARLNAEYYPTLRQNDLIAYEWMRIPHFYRAFYVYKYATGFSAAMALAGGILREGAPAVQRYRKFLSLGGSMHPIDLLKVAGVDMSRRESVEAALDEFDRLVDRYLALTE